MLIAVVFVAAGCEFVPGAAVQPVVGSEQIKQAKYYLDRGLDDSAMAAFGLAIEENSKLTEAHLGMGHIYFDRKNYKLASRSFLIVTHQDPDSFDGHYYLGLINQLTNRVDRALPMYLRALAIRPNSFEANHNLGSAYYQLGRYAEALSYATRAAQLDPISQGAWANLAATYSRLGRYEQAVDAYRCANELGEARTPIHLGLADALIKMNQYERAAVVLQGINRRDPAAMSYERLGFCQFKRNKFDDALASFRAALSIDKEDTASLNGLGVCLMTLYLQSGRQVRAQWREALRAWRRSVLLDADQPRIIDLISRYQAGYN